MKKTFKKILVTSATIALTILPGVNVSTVFANGWQQDNKGWRYVIDDNWGWYCNSWQWLDGNNDGIAECYYFGADGYMVANDKTPDGYTVNADGAWVNNGTVQTKAAEKAHTMPDYNLLFGSYSDSESTYTNNTAAANNTDFSNYARECFDLINKKRTSRGLDALEWDDTIAEACDIRSQELAEKDSHTRPNGTRFCTVFEEIDDEYAYKANCKYGENIASGYTSPEAVTNGWMNSTGHRKNILTESYVRGAIGFYYNKGNGEYYWVQIFAKDLDTSSSSKSSSSSSKSSSSSLDDMSDEEFQAYAQKLSGDSDEFVARNNVRYLRPGTAEYDAFNSLINYDD